MGKLSSMVISFLECCQLDEHCSNHKLTTVLCNSRLTMHFRLFEFHITLQEFFLYVWKSELAQLQLTTKEKCR